MLKEYPDIRPATLQSDTNQSDRMFIRNVAMTGPYFHNGKVATMEEAVTQMAE